VTSLAQSSDTLPALSPSDRAIAELKAVIGEGVNKAVFFDVVRGTGLLAPDGRAWSYAKLNDSINLLIRKRVLSAEGVILPDWQEPLILSLIHPAAGAMSARPIIGM
jgi:hypothetical protein